MKVLIVDDSALVRERLTTILSEVRGVQIVGEAKDSDGAKVGINKLKPNVVILDIRMPNGSGIEVLGKIKESQTPPVVIMLTNYPYPQYRKKCMEAGADFFFDKSTEFEKVAEVLKELVRNSKGERPDEDKGRRSRGGTMNDGQ